jgi:Lipocalin-like domain
MTLTASDLIGTWALESWSLVYEDGRSAEYPLGRDAIGRIMYTGDGHVSAMLMRAGRKPLSDMTDQSKAQAWDDCFAYTGRFEVRDQVAYHSIEVATNPALVGVTSPRHILLDGNRLTLSGPDFSPGSPRHHRIIWRRPKPEVRGA